MSYKLKRAKNRRDSAPFLKLPLHMLAHDNFRSLSYRAKSLLLDVASQFRGHNNGDLCASLTIMKSYGWTSSDQLHKARKELEERGWLIETRKGARPNIPTLYALAWLPINDCGGKLLKKATDTAPNTWKQAPPPKVPRKAPCSTVKRSKYKPVNAMLLDED
ncbi:hypothetical protein [Hahella sp. HN01]|uniref:hypothetical protein n=1 Tax=Hahella sp. HN01 TaxID=2847262 RepID=UPI001C1ED74B|nr:hypothetical protein [Hahella sp. HN01]MBU6951618.1 hypothetical protein [Hahella sp. HN01]